MVKPDAIQFGGHCAGATELYLWPGVKGLRGGEFIADPHTAGLYLCQTTPNSLGSITLLLQASLPCALLGARSEAGTSTHDHLEPHHSSENDFTRWYQYQWKSFN